MQKTLPVPKPGVTELYVSLLLENFICFFPDRICWLCLYSLFFWGLLSVNLLLKNRYFPQVYGWRKRSNEGIINTDYESSTYRTWCLHRIPGWYIRTSAFGFYAKPLGVYYGAGIVYFFVFFSLYALVANGTKGIKLFWKNNIVPSFTAISTCSSLATMPANLDAARKIGIPDSIANVVIPIGTTIHKTDHQFLLL